MMGEAEFVNLAVLASGLAGESMLISCVLLMVGVKLVFGVGLLVWSSW